MPGVDDQRPHQCDHNAGQVQEDAAYILQDAIGGSIVGVVGVCRCQLCSDLSSIDEMQQARPTG